MSAQSRARLNTLQAIALVLGLLLMVTGIYFPTVTRELAPKLGAIINVTGNAQISVSPTSINVGSAFTVSGTGFPSGSIIIEAFEPSGARFPNLNPTMPFTGNVGSTGSFSQSFTVSAPDLSCGATQCVVTIWVSTYMDVIQKQATLTVNYPATQIQGTVTLKGGDGQTFTLTASSNIQTTSPLCFRVAITQGVTNVQTLNLQYRTYPSGSFQTQQMVRGTAVCGLPTDPNSWYGTLTLAPGTYEVKVQIISTQGSTLTLLSILGYFDISPPVDVSYWAGAAVMLVGAVTVIGAAYMPVQRRMP